MSEEVSTPSEPVIMINRDGRLTEVTLRAIRSSMDQTNEPLIVLTPKDVSDETVAKVIDRAIEVSQVRALQQPEVEKGAPGTFRAYLAQAGLLVLGKPSALPTEYAWDEDIILPGDTEEYVCDLLREMDVKPDEQPEDLDPPKGKGDAFAISCFSQATERFGVSRDANPYAKTAYDKRHKELEFEVDDLTVVSYSGDGGAYVLGWTWIADEDVDPKDLPRLPLDEIRADALEALENGDPDECVRVLKRAGDDIDPAHKELIRKAMKEADNGSIDAACTFLEQLPE